MVFEPRDSVWLNPAALLYNRRLFFSSLSKAKSKFEEHYINDKILCEQNVRPSFGMYRDRESYLTNIFHFLFYGFITLHNMLISTWFVP